MKHRISARNRYQRRSTRLTPKKTAVFVLVALMAFSVISRLIMMPKLKHLKVKSVAITPELRNCQISPTVYQMRLLLYKMSRTSCRLKLI